MNAATTTDAFLDLELAVEVWLGTETVPLERLLSLEPGGVLPLSHDPDGPVQLVVNGAVVATGELVVVEGKFGFRVTDTVGRELRDLAEGSGSETPEIEPSVEIDAQEALSAAAGKEGAAPSGTVAAEPAGGEEEGVQP